MQLKTNTRFLNILLVLLVAGVFSACSSMPIQGVENGSGLSASENRKSGLPSKVNNLQGVYPVDDIFIELYNQMGGKEVLGPAISPVSREGTRQLQYVENALLVHDENASTRNRLRLGPLGLEFGIAENSESGSPKPNGRYVGGRLVWHEFVAKYDALGGVRYVGEPITEARFNPAKLRTEQYFENLGFYRLEADEPGVVRLMAYGAYACDYRCRYPVQSQSIPERQPVLPDQFQSLANRLGIAFTGRALTGVHLAADQKEEVIFENLVLYKTAQRTSSVTARPIVKMLGFTPQALVGSDSDPLMTFYEIQAGKGYNIPRLFDDYIQRHGGIEISGPPLSEVFPIKFGGFRQCFANLCLDYDLNAPPAERLRPAPLGARYMGEFFEKGMDFSKILSVKDVNLFVWEKYMRLSAGDPQEIYVSVSEAGTPLTNREPVLTLTDPNGAIKTFYFPPTGEDGLTSINIPGIEAPNGSLIAYKVCLMGFNNEAKCVGENYLIWNSN